MKDEQPEPELDSEDPEFIFDPDEKLYKTSEIAELFSVTDETVRSWARKGKLHSIKIGRGQIRVPRSSLMKFANDRFGNE